MRNEPPLRLRFRGVTRKVRLKCVTALGLLLALSFRATSGEVRVSLEPCKLSTTIEAKASGKTTTVRLPIDFYVVVENISQDALRFYEDSNSWGYERLKLVLHNGWHEYWITKRPVAWYRNFESFVTLGPAESLKIPVALDDAVWDLAEATKDTTALEIRAIYDQPMLGGTNLPPATMRLWIGIESSPYYCGFRN